MLKDLRLAGYRFTMLVVSPPVETGLKAPRGWDSLAWDSRSSQLNFADEFHVAAFLAFLRKDQKVLGDMLQIMREDDDPEDPTVAESDVQCECEDIGDYLAETFETDDGFADDLNVSLDKYGKVGRIGREEGEGEEFGGGVGEEEDVDEDYGDFDAAEDENDDGMQLDEDFLDSENESESGFASGEDSWAEFLNSVQGGNGDGDDGIGDDGSDGGNENMDVEVWAGEEEEQEEAFNPGVAVIQAVLVPGGDNNELDGNGDWNADVNEDDEGDDWGGIPGEDEYGDYIAHD